MSTFRNLVCTCTRSARAKTISIPHLSIRNFNQSTKFSSEPAPVPWFVDSTISTPSGPSKAPRLATSPIPLPPPTSLPLELHPLYANLSISPFLDSSKITFINAREADPENSWCDWIVVCTLKQGREGGLRGAIEGVRSFLATKPISLSPAPAPSPFSPPSRTPLITGLPLPPSKHARGRAPSPSRAEQAVGWALLDTGNVVIHVFTAEARKNWNLEGVWNRIAKENDRTVVEEDEMEEPTYAEGEEHDSMVAMDGIDEGEMDLIGDGLDEVEVEKKI